MVLDEDGLVGLAVGSGLSSCAILSSSESSDESLVDAEGT